jgi:tRNA pseudouridine38-40 synthase
MGRYLIYLEYDGTDFSGFQLQPGRRTVQGEVENRLFRITGRETRITGAGRTDSGVHALAMPAHVDTDRGPEALEAAGRILPRDIALSRIVPVPPDFHARFDAVERTYVYRIGSRKSPLRARTEFQPGLSLDGEAMNLAAGMCIGRGDWRGFARTGGGNRTWSMDVREARVIRDRAGWTITITSDRFLRGVVRIWAGTLLRVGAGRLSPDAPERILRGEPGCSPGPSLPARGLTLVEVGYHGIPEG